jgi:hypothetical protein
VTAALVLDRAGPADEPALRRLLRETPLPGAVALSLEREPDWHRAAAVEGDRHAVLVARRAGEVVGVAARAVRTGFVDGAPARVGYLGQLRLAPGARGDLALLREGFARLAADRRPGELPFDLTSIVADNVRARRLLEAGRAGLPVYAPLATLETLALAPGGRAPRRVATPPAGAWPEVAAFVRREAARFQLAPAVDAAWLASPARCPGLAPADWLVVEDGRGLAAAGALWDQRAVRQVVVRGYAPALRLLRPLLAAVGPALGLPRLPPPGAPLATAYLAFAHARGDDPAAFGALLDAARAGAARRGLDAVVLGLAADHPLLAEATRRRHRGYRSILYAVHGAEGAAAVAALGRRVLAPEVATL